MNSNFCYCCGARLDNGVTLCPMCGTDNAQSINAGQYAQPQYGTQPQQAQQQSGYGTQQQYAQPQQSYTAQPQTYGATQYMQPQYGAQQPQPQQPYVIQIENVQSGYGAPYVQEKPSSIFSKILGGVLIGIGAPITLILGLAALINFFSGDIGAAILLGVVGLLGFGIGWVGIKQFKSQRTLVNEQLPMNGYGGGMQQPQQNMNGYNGGGYQQPNGGYNGGAYQQPNSGYNGGGYQQPNGGYNGGGYQQPNNGYNGGGYQQPNGGYNGGAYQQPNNGYSGGYDPSKVDLTKRN